MIREDRINRLGRYWQNKYDCKVYKIIVKGDFTCPNLQSSSGCIFCNMSSMITKTEKDGGGIMTKADNKPEGKAFGCGCFYQHTG